MGQLYCANSSCTFLNTAGKQNTVHWDNINKKETCHSCGIFALIQPCPTRKVTEFDCDTNILTVYHLGIHVCQLKLPHSYHDPYHRKAIKANLQAGL